MEDNYRHKGQRKQLIDNLREKGMISEKVLGALNNVPRHLFFEKAFWERAYEDKAFPIGAGQTISQPYTVAFQTELLDVQKGDKILEVGTGSGYQASVLAELGAKVFTIERQKTLYEKTRKLLPAIGYKTIKFFFGDGYKGLPAFAPFDKVIVTAGAPFIPQDLIDQMIVGGIMVIPVNHNSYQVMTTVRKISEDQVQQREHGEFRFVPMLGDKAWG